jgi:hypothetical protein
VELHLRSTCEHASAHACSSFGINNRSFKERVFLVDGFGDLIAPRPRFKDNAY